MEDAGREIPEPAGAKPRVRAASVLARALVGVAMLAGCGDDVTFCSDFDEDPPACEICNNDRDDDLDGETDCDDEDCEGAGVCRDQDAKNKPSPPSFVAGSRVARSIRYALPEIRAPDPPAGAAGCCLLLSPARSFPAEYGRIQTQEVFP